MTSRSSSEKPVGVIGAGNFGTAIANILARNRKVYLYARNEKVVEQIKHKHENRGQKMNRAIVPTHDLAFVAAECDVIFPIVPSLHFRDMMRKLSKHLHPYHILIHGGVS